MTNKKYDLNAIYSVPPGTIKNMDEIIEDFKILWESAGKPHPNSKRYANLTRIFFYQCGLEAGMEIGAMTK